MVGKFWKKFYLSLVGLAIYRRLCPNCYGRTDDSRLREGFLCQSCQRETGAPFPDFCPQIDSPEEMAIFCPAAKKLDEFAQFFRKNLGASPWGMQITWAKRVFLKESFALIAPTGVGKTTFGLNMAAFLGRKSYILVPTRLLVQTTREKLDRFAPALKVVAYTGKKRDKSAIQSGDFDILVTTVNFLAHNNEILPTDFDFVFVDDVDSLLKSGKNVDRVLKLVGVAEKDLKTAETILKLKSQLAISQSEWVRKKIEKLQKYLTDRRENYGILVVSSATLTPKTRRVNLFRELLGFDVGKEISFLRNVEDIAIFPGENLFERTAELIEKLGRGTFVYVPAPAGKQGADKLKQILSGRGISCITYEEINEENRHRFETGEIACVVGIASSRNPLTRGVDLPYAVRFAVFAGVPRMEFPIKAETIAGLYNLLGAIRAILEPQQRRTADKFRKFFKPHLALSSENLERYPNIHAKFREGTEFVQKLFASGELREKALRSPDVSIAERDGEFYVIVGDAVSYIQASGRTSRLYAGGITRGASFVLVDDLKGFASLFRRLGYMGFEVSFRVLGDAVPGDFALKFNLETISEEELEKLIAEIHSRREELVASASAGETVDLVKSALMVVESPNKARTISSFFGKPLRREVYGIPVYEISVGEYVLLICASKGHIFDLVTTEGKYGVLMEDTPLPVYDTIKHCRKCNEQTTEELCPVCRQKPDEDKIDLVRALRRLGYEVELVFVATDPDTEGEKIAWDLENIFRVFVRDVRRMEFHEVTRRAILRALSAPRQTDPDLVKAQLLRRIADRWLGFALSEKLKRYFGDQNLSAGRVQTPVLGWVIERTHRARKKKKVLVVRTGAGRFSFEIPEGVAPPRPVPELKFEIVRTERRQREIITPFNTPELLLEASRVLKFPAVQTMKLAQDLFESGLITYHRTDSVRVSSSGIEVAKQYIAEHFGKEFFVPRSFASSEGAHECIRPTRPWDAEQIEEIREVWGRFADLTTEHLKLYDLIFKRFLASQMRPPTVVEATVELRIPENEQIRTRISCALEILSRGYDLILPIPTCKLKAKSGVLPAEGAELRKIPEVNPFTQGELIDQMRKKGIGRPSTYAKIVETLLRRRYVIEIRGKLYSTRRGEMVYSALVKNFGDLVSEEITRQIEDLQDRVENREIDYYSALEKIRTWLAKIEHTAIK